MTFIRDAWMDVGWFDDGMDREKDMMGRNIFLSFNSLHKIAQEFESIQIYSLLPFLALTATGPRLSEFAKPAKSSLFLMLLRSRSP
jgi:hypothetical protein